MHDDTADDLIEKIQSLRRDASEMNLPPDLLLFVSRSLRRLEGAVTDDQHGVADSTDVVSVWWQVQQEVESLKGGGAGRGCQGGARGAGKAHSRGKRNGWALGEDAATIACRDVRSAQVARGVVCWR